MSEVFLKILNMSISASWLVLAVLLLRLILKKAPKWVSVILWGFVAIRLICPFSIESVLSLIPSAETVSPEIMMDWTPSITTGIESVDTVINPIISQAFAPKPYASANPLQILIPVASVAWLSGIAVMLIYTVITYILLQRKVATAVLFRNNIYQSENVDSPFVLGILKPKIYLPFQMDGQNLEYVIAHEEAHIRRKDHWWKPVGFLLLALHWFNPLMWLGYILLCRDIELACDERVIKEMDNASKADYTQALVDCSVNRRRIAACPLAFGEVGVKERVKSVMNYKKPAFWIVVAAIVSCIAVAVCFLTNPKTNPNDTPPLVLDTDNADSYQFVATVLEVHDTYLMVAPEPDFVAASSADKIEVSLQNLKSLPTLQVGDLILIEYDGMIQETYPARITTLYQVEILYLFSDPVETIYGNVKTYFRNADGTWQTGGRNYKYRHVLTGRTPNSIHDTSFIYLSNLEHITFEQAWKAAGFGSTEDYFAVEDAVLVGWSDVASGGQVDAKLDAAITDAILMQHADSVPDGYLATESHILVSQVPARIYEPHDTLQEEFTAYNGIFAQVYYLHLPFDVSGNVPLEHERIFKEVIIAFEINEQNEYVKIGFVSTEIGVMPEGYEDHEKTGGKVDISEYEHQYQEQLLASCWSAAAAYIENRNASESIPDAEYGGIIDKISYDIDGDGTDEICTLTYGQTSGLFSFFFYISSADGNSAEIEYSQAYFLRGHYYLSFELAENGQLRIKGERNTDLNEVVYFDITLQNGYILLKSDKEGILLT